MWLIVQQLSNWKDLASPAFPEPAGRDDRTKPGACPGQRPAGLHCSSATHGYWAPLG